MVPGGLWHIRIDDEMRSKVGKAPEGWVPLDRAAEALGVARQTVLDRIRRGELRAVHVKEADAKVWRSRLVRSPAIHSSPSRAELCQSVQAPPLRGV